MSENPLVGKQVVGVDLATDKKALRFRLADNEAVVVLVDGDCCSATWIESLDDPAALLGNVQSVEDIEMPDLGTPPDSECVQYYGCKITTDRGVCVIDYRNESNGYYGGNLAWPGDDHYGGVLGQNKSTQEWKAVTR